MTGAELVQLLRGYRLRSGDEASFQRAVQRALTQAGVAFEAEYDLGSHGRIDFFVPSTGLGIECKVQGSPSDVAAQLLRYAQDLEISALVLVTARARLGDLPTTLNAKPLYVYSTWRTSL